MVAPTEFSYRSGDLIVRIGLDIPGGRTVLHLGPFGDLWWHTHRTPVTLEATFVLQPTVEGLPDLDRLGDLRWSYLGRKLPWLLASATLFGILLSEGSRRRRALAAAATAAGAVALVTALVGATVLTFDPSALDAPSYRGPIQDAPRVLQLLQEAERDLAGTYRNINDMAAGLERIHAQLGGGVAPRAEPTIRLLVLSDLHDNVLGLVIARELVTRFDVQAVLNGGDFTDRGTKAEADLFARFADLGVPEVVVAGNHEDAEAMASVRRVPMVQVLESRTAQDVATVAGITVLGDSDPNAYFVSSDPNDARALRLLPALCARLAERWAVVHPQILLVHNPKMGDCVEDAAAEAGTPLVYVWGHLHRQSYEVNGSVVSVSPGTSGANGFKTARPAPYGFSLLEFSERDHSLVSVCQFLFERPSELDQASCFIQPPERTATPPSPAPAPSAS